jgi:exonuclease SbcC
MLVQTLPVPVSGIINHICHISDIHIRSGTESKDDKNSRFTEYINTFNSITNFLKTTYTNNDMVICIIGDILHDNKKAGAPCIELFYEIMNKLSDVAPVYIIRGNHDYNQSSIASQDLLGSLMYGLKHKNNVFYLSKTGQYNAGNISFGVAAIQDVLDAGNTCGLSNDLIEFPKTSEFEKSENIKIALFHGNIYQTTSIKWITQNNNYNYVLLGDLHCQQVSVKETNSDIVNVSEDVYRIKRYKESDHSKLLWGYAGSTIQQNYGESIIGHGFLMWDIENHEVDCYHVKNNYNFLSSSINQQIAYNISYSENQKVFSNWKHIEELINNPLISTNLRLRIQKYPNHSSYETKKVLEELETNNFKIESSKEQLIIQKTKEQSKSVKLDDIELYKLNNPVAWHEYVTKHSTKSLCDNWKDWFLDPNSLLINANDLPELFKRDVDDRNKKINASIKDYHESFEINQIHCHSCIDLLYMNWSHILCFDANCYFNFQDLKGNVHCIGGKNGYGKTSFLETICIALYGETLPSRTSKHISSSFINFNIRPSSMQRAFTSIVVKIDNSIYRIVRSFSRVSKDENKIQTKDTSLEVLEDQFKLVHSGKKAVTEWINKKLGGIDTFLTSCMITQTLDNDFFSKKSNDQKIYIDNQLKLNSSTCYLHVLKNVKLAYNEFIKRLNDLLETKYQKDPVKTINFIKNKIELLNNTYQKTITTLDNLVKKQDDLYKYIDNVEKCLFDYNKDELISKSNKLLEYLNDNKGLDVETIETIVDNVAILKEKYKSFEKYFDSSENKSSLKKKINEHNNKKPQKIGIYNKHVIEHQIDEIKKQLKTKNTKDQLLKQKNLSKKLSQSNQELDSLKNNLDLLNQTQKELQLIQKNTVLHLSENNQVITKHEYETCISQLNELKTKYNSISEIDDNIDINKKNNTSNDIDKIFDRLKQYSTKWTHKNVLIEENELMCKVFDESIEKFAHIEVQKTNNDTKELLISSILNKWIRQNEEKINMIESFKNEYFVNKDLIDNKKKWVYLNENINNYEKIENKNKIAREKSQQTNELISNNLNEVIEKTNQYQEKSQMCNDMKNKLNTIESCQKNESFYTKLEKELSKLSFQHNSIIQYEIWNERHESLKSKLIAFELLDELNSMLYLKEQIIKFSNSKKDFQTVSKCLEVYDTWTEFNSNKLKTSKLLETKDSLNTEITLLNAQLEDILAIKNEIDILDNYNKNILEKFNSITHIMDVFTHFKDWCIEQQIIPIITDHVNIFLNEICQNHRPLYLKCEFDTITKSFIWFVIDGDFDVPFEKCSGFQKFAINLGMRIVLGKLGVSGMRNSQLFIDEGFTSCDTNNLDVIPDVLETMLKTYSSIFIVTHLDNLKEKIKMSIDIFRNEEKGISHIGFGNHIDKFESIKKVGRPKLNIKGKN